ncbi:MAG: nucleotidyltransferase family protein [Sandaracinaceae bacterium]|nr:nucleotidyltransferase family protein [Sandaracinaceae bacterium]
MGLDEVHAALERLTVALEEDGIPYAIVGAMALNAHGYRRVTTAVDVLLTPEGLARFKQKHLGLGWVERFPGSKGMRDSSGVKIDVLLTGDYSGDGKPKAVRFPDPSVAVQGDGFRVVSVRHLVELKLASGMSNPDRLKDLADVQELVRHIGLGRELGDELDPTVRDKYQEIWSATRRPSDDDDDL